MGKMVVAFLLAWLATFAGYSWASHSTWREKATVVKNIFIALLTSTAAVITVASFIHLF